ncbi:MULTISPECIES: MarR family winged helix-turn-helix transcriptional regulator [Mumia]|uniref:MarR family winged helix-turn-helix transcriptional regulator n=1 Tax=Mumia TaxID=1546255 RepID=UPI001421C799|nr:MULTISPECIES: MarR family transcriptional regulator [unclassified Mumia]QMW67539.1 MarR family transcriptional regulator [Mumia sp. ZJ1417]
MTATSTTSTSLDAWRAYASTHERLVRHLAREITRETGLSDADYIVLEALVEAPDGRMRSRDLRLALEWEKSRLSHQARRMEQRGLLARETCAADGRSADVVITQAGRQAAARARAIREESLRTLVLDTLGTDRVDVLAQTAELLAARLARATEEDPHCRAALAEDD